jgi:hypothetical protein
VTDLNFIFPQERKMHMKRREEEEDEEDCMLEEVSQRLRR